MAFDIGGDEWARRDHFQLLCSRIPQGCFRQLGRDSLSPVVFRYFSVQQIQPAIGLRVVDLRDLVSEVSFKAVACFVAADWVIGHGMIMTLETQEHRQGSNMKF